jgi:hypothetical protein
MSKLDDIFNDIFVQTLELRLEEDIPLAKQEVKNLLMGLLEQSKDKMLPLTWLTKQIENL